MNEERSTQELIQTLGDDFDRCYHDLVATFDEGEIDAEGNLDADYEFYARQLIRAAFAYIEALTFSVKASSAWSCMEKGIEITPQERYFATDTEYEINEKGEIVECAAKISLARNIRFAFALNEKAHEVSKQFDPSVEWWCCMKESIKVRDRLTHPKMPSDLDVSPDELIKVLKAKNGFESELMRHINTDA